MDRGMKDISLLDYLAEQCGCEYLSDLRYMDGGEISDTLLRISEGMFPREQWKDAYDYLVGETAIGENYVSKETLMKDLRKKKEAGK